MNTNAKFSGFVFSALIVSILLVPLMASGANRLWTGLGANGNWTTAANWSNNVTPVGNDFLTFSFGAPRLLTTNTFTANTLFSGIKLQDSYTLRGAAVDLTNFVEVGASATGTLDLDVRLQAPLIFSADLNSKFVYAVNRTITLNNFALTLDGLGAAHEFDGVISDLASAPSKVIINGASSLGSSGNTVVFNGAYVGPGPILVTNTSSLVLNGSSRAAVIVASTTSLRGAGSMGGLIASGRVTPGPANGFGSLTVNGPCTLSSSASFVASIAGTNAGVTYSQLRCGTNVNLGSAQLVIARSSSFFPTIGDRFTVLSKTNSGAISGTFAGLLQGASVNVGGVFYQITYTGGDGNDVTLIVTNTDTHTWDGGGANALWSNATNWEAHVAPSVSNNVVFPRTALNAVCTNDFPADTVFNSLRFTGTAATNNYPRLRGNSLRLLSGLVATNLGSQGVVALELPIKLAASQTFTNGSTTTAIELRSNLLVQPFNLTIGGPGVFRTTGLVTGTNNASLIQVSGGHLVVDGTLDGNLSVTNGGELAGTGTVGALTVTNSALSPGDGGPGILTVKGGLSLSSASVFNVGLSNSTPGSGYDQVVVSNGNVALAFPSLNLSVATNLGSIIGDTFTLIKVTNPTNIVSGTFAGLAQGALITNNGAVFTVSYSGGDGNDVTLTLANILSTGTERFWSGADATTNAWSFRTNWSLDIAPIGGDSLHFPIGLVSRRTNFNDLLADTTFGALRFDGDNVNDVLLGNPFRLNDGVRLEPGPGTFTLALPGTMTVSNRVTLNHPQTFTNAVDGTLRFAGGVVLGTNTLSVKVRDGTDVSFDGPITGAGRLEATADGRVNLNASNAVTGQMMASSGVLVAKNSQALGTATTGPVQVGSAGTLRFQSSNTVFTGSLITLTGRVEVVNSPNSSLATPLVTAGPTPVFSNPSGLFTLISPLTNTTLLTATGLRLAPGARIEGGGMVAGSGPGLNGGSLEADGTVHNLVLPGTLTGAGAIDAVTCTNLFSVVQPGSTTDPTLAFTPLQIGRLRLNNNASVRFQLFPNRPGGGPTNTSLISTSAPDLGGAKLVLTALTNLAPNQKFTLLRNDSAAPVTNTFLNLPEGSFLSANGGNLGLQISYRAGDGNDVVVTVQSNTPPVIAQPTLFVAEQTPLVYTNTAVDFDQPAQVITWSLLSAPAGVNLNASNGVLTWTPTESQGPSTNNLLVRATDSGLPPLSSTGTVTVIVQEVNLRPVSTSITNTNVLVGSTLTMQLTASDPDIPANPITWSAQLPPDATLSSNGLFTFTPTTNFPGTRTFQLNVADFSPQAINENSLTNTFTLAVRVDIARTVINTNDSGPGSLRQAILDVNNTPGANPGGGLIGFNIPGTGPFKIFLISALPQLLHDMTIDGYTQPGSHPNTLTNSNNAQPFIELSGENITAVTNGLGWSGPRVTLRGLVINRWDTGIATGHVGTGGLTPNAIIEGCFVGTDPTGTVAKTNRVGINFLEAFNGRIGGPAPALRNLISGNAQAGIALVWDNVDSSLHNLTIQNNFIGTDRTGTNLLGNGGFGISSQSTIPTTNSVIADNVISGNGQGGLQLAGARNFVLRNKIGLGVDGIQALTNGGAGVEVFGNGCLVGGNNGLDANLIGNNNGPGVHVISGTNNAILGNSIFRNNGLGIDLGPLGPNPNDLGDPDTGPNQFQNTPTLVSNIVADSSVVVVNGNLASTVLSNYRIEFFHSPDFAPANQPQGRTFLGSTDVTTDGNGNAGFSVSTLLPSLSGFVTATATDTNGNTSEISPPATIERADFYAGVLPQLKIVSGNNQSGSANLFLPNPLVVLITDTNGTPFTNAPLTFVVVQGDATLAEAFTVDQSISLPVRTDTSGQAQIFCHLGPTVGASDVISAIASSAGRTTNVSFFASSVAPTVPGILLQGDTNSVAVGAMPDITAGPAAKNEIEDGVIMTRLEMYLENGATVGQVNDALQSIGGRILTTVPEAGALTVAVPPQTDLNGLVQLSALLNQLPGVNRVDLVNVFVTTILPPSPAGDPANFTQLEHLLPVRFPAAWNAAFIATNNCGAKRVSVFVADHFDPDLTSASDFHAEIPFFTKLNFESATDPHGIEVSTTVAALFNSRNPTGANPFSGCLFIDALDISQIGPLDSMKLIERNFPAGKFILNCSWGFLGHCLGGSCTKNQFGTIIPPASRRAYDGAVWNKLTAFRWDDFLICVAAGNDKDETSAQLYPGLGNSRFISPMTVGAEADQSFSFVLDPSLWDPSLLAVGLGLPTMRVTNSTEFAALQREIQALGGVSTGPANNELIVGSTTNGFHFSDLQESDSSNSGADVLAVGEHIFTLDGTLVGGTSFASPQVAGLASYLWLLSDGLRSLPARIARNAILLNARAVPQSNGQLDRVIDAYASVLSLDQAVLPTASTAPVRLAILDVNNDGKFDENDLLIHLYTNGLAGATGTNDYGRSDLNGDGFTGGSGTERVDLDRIGSQQFGLTSYSVVTQTVEGLSIQYDESAVSDMDVLCYCAYSGLYTGDTNARSTILADLCTAKVAVGVFPEGTSVHTGQSFPFFAAVSGIADQRVTWSVIPPSAGTITSDGVFTPSGCPTNLNVDQNVTIRATSVVATNRFGDASVLVQYPIRLRFNDPGTGFNNPFTLFLGRCNIFTAGQLPMPLTDSGLVLGLGCGSNRVSYGLSSACNSSGTSFDLQMDAFASTDTTTQNVEPVAGWEVRANFTAPVATTITATFGSDWAGDLTRVGSSKQLTALFNGGGISNAQATFNVTSGTLQQNSPLPPFQIPKGASIDINLDALCVFGCNGGGRAWSVIFSPAGPVGIFHLDPAVQTVSALQVSNLAFAWTVPDPFNWHHLRELQLLVHEENEVVLLLRFNEADRSFSEYDAAAGRFGPSFKAGSKAKLASALAWLDLSRTSVVASGPTSPTVTLNLALGFEPAAGGRTYTVEVSATDDAGNTDPFIAAGRVTVLSGTTEAPLR
jgi:hypothetical protein